MAKRNQISLETLDQLINKLDQVYDKLNSVEKQLDGLSKKTLSIRVDPKFTKSIDNLRKLFEALQEMNVSTKNVSALQTAIKHFVAATAEMNSIKGVPKDLNKMLSAMQKVVDFISRIDLKGNLDKVDAFTRALNSIIKAFSISDSGGGVKGGITKLIGDVSRLFKFFVLLPGLFTWLTVSFKGVSLLSMFIPSDSAFLRLSTGFRMLAVALNTLNSAFGSKSQQKDFAAFRATVASVIRIGVLFPMLFTQLVYITRSISLISQILPGSQEFTRLTTGFSLIGRAFDDLNNAFGGGKGKGLSALGATIASFVRIAVLFPTLTVGLTTIIRGLSIISSILPGQQAFTRLSDGFHQVGLAFKAINTAFGGGQKTFGGGFIATISSIIRIGVIFPVLFTQLTLIFRSLSAILSVMPGHNAFVQLAQGFRNMGDALVSLSEINGKFRIGSLLQLSAVVKRISGIFQSITKSFIREDAVQAFSVVAKGFADMGEALRRLPEGAANFNIPTIIRLFVALTTLKKLATGLGKGISRDRAEVIQIMANVIGTIGQSVRRIVLSINEIGARGVSFNIGPINKILNSLKSLIKTFSKLSTRDVNPTNLAAMADIVKAVSSVIRTLAGLSKISIGRDSSKIFDTVKRQFKGLNDLVKQLSKVKPVNAQSITGMVDALAKVLVTTNKFSGKVDKFDDFIVLSKKMAQAVKAFNLGPLASRKAKQLQELMSVFTALSKTKGGSITGFVKSLQHLKNIDLKKVDLSGVGSIAKELSKAAVHLRNVDFSDLGDFSKFADSLSKLAIAQEKLGHAQTNLFKTTYSAKSIRTSQTLTEAIADGTEQGIRRILLMQALIKAVQNFNPVSLAIKLGGFFENVYNRVKQIIDLVQWANRKIRESVQYIGELGSNLSDIGNRLVSNFGVGALLNSSGFQIAVDFDTLSTQLQTFGRLTDEQLARAQSFADTIGIDYPLSANEAMEAILSLTKAGQNLDSIERILPSAADLASLSDSKDINQATALLIGAQAAFKEFADGVPATFDNVAMAADIVANSADLTFASVEQLQEGLANVGPIASQYGLSFVDVNAILGQFSNANLLGAEAGTALKSALTNLNTDVAKRELSRLGVSLTDAQGNFRDLNDIIVDLNSAFTETSTIRIATLPGVSRENQEQVKQAQKVLESATRNLFLWQNQLASGSDDPEKAAQKIAEYNRQISAAQATITQLTGSQEASNYITREVTRTQQQNAESIKKIFGSYGQVAGSILLAAGGFGELRDNILNGGTAAERARMLMDNFAGDIEQLRGSLETLNKNAFLPLIEKVFRPFVKLGRLIVDSILEMDSRVMEFISTAIAFGSILATIIGTGAMVVGTLISIGSGFALLALKLTSVLTVGGAIVGGLAAIATGFIVVTGVVAGVTAILAGVTAAFEALRKVFSEDIGGARSAFEEMFSLIASTGSSVIGFFQALGNLLGAIFSRGDVGVGLEGLGSGIAGLFKSVTNSGVLHRFRKGVNDVTEVFNAFGAALNLGDNLRKAAEDVKRNYEIAARYTTIGADTIEHATELAQERVMEQYNAIADALLDNSIVKRFFGEELLNRRQVRDFLGNFLYFADQLRFAVRQTLGSFSAFFTNLKTLGIGGALEQLGRDLNDGFKNVFLVVLRGIQTLFRVDLSDVIGATEAGGLADGVVKLFQNMLGVVREKLIQNRKGIVSVLKTLFNVMFAPLKSVAFVARLFGITPLENIVSKIQDVVGGLFEGVLNTIFNLLEGASLGDALRSAFGEGIEPLLDFFDVLQKIGATISRAISNIFGGVKEGLGEGFNLSEFLTGLLEDFTGFLDQFNDKVLSPLVDGDFLGALSGVADMLGSDFLSKIIDSLARGDFGTLIGDIAAEIGGIISRALQAVPAFITDLGTTLNSPLLVAIGEDLANGDWLGVIGEIANGIKNVITSALGVVPTLITDLGELINSPMLTAIGENLANGDFQAIISIITTNLSSLITNAIAAVPALITDLGTTLNSPLLTKIGDDLANGDFTEVISTIANGIKNLIESAIEAVPGLLTDLGQTLHLDVLTDFAITLEQTELFERIGAVLGNLAGFALETVSSALTGIKDAVNALNMNPLTAASVVGVLAAISAFAYRHLIISQATVAFNALKTSFMTFARSAGRFILLATAIVTIKNVLENLGTLLQGDFYTGLGDTLAGIAEDILNLTGLGDLIKEKFGVDLDASYISAQLQLIPELLEVILNDAAERISTGVRNIFDGLMVEAIRTFSRIAVAGGLAQEGFGVDFYKIDESLAAIQNIIATEGSNLILDQAAQQAFGTIADTLADPANRDFVTAQLRTAYAAIFDAFTRTDFRTGLSGTAEQQQQVADIFSILIGADGLVEGAAFIGQTYGADFLSAMFSNLLEYRPEALEGVDIASVLTELTRKTFGGQVGAGVAINIADSLLLTGQITQEQYDTFKAGIERQIAELAAANEAAATGTPQAQVDVPVEVSPTPTLPPEGPEEFKSDVQTLIQDGLGALTGTEQEPISTEVPVNPEFQVPTTAAEVDTLATNLSTALTNLGLLKTDLLAFPTDAQPAIDKLNEMGVSLTDVHTQVSDVIAKIGTLTTETITNTVTTATQLAQSKNSWQVWSTQVRSALNPIISKLQDLNLEIAKAVAGLSGLGNAEVNVNVGGGVDGGRAEGGPVRRGGLYEIIEDGTPETLYQNGKYYLLSAGGGYVSPLTALPGLGTADRRVGINGSGYGFGRPFSPSTNSSSSVIIEHGDIVINVDATTTSDLQQLANQIAITVRREIDNRNANVRSRLRTGHR